MAAPITYEEISDRLGKLGPPHDAKHINVDWVVEGILAIGRDGENRNAVCLIGPELQPSAPAVARAIRHATWETPNGERLTGNLIGLPPGDHFRAASSTITVELVRHDIAHRPLEEVFFDVEPLVELVIHRLLLPPECILGLIGELLVLDIALAALSNAGKLEEDCTAIWRGHTRQSRDFFLGSSAIEVKTTGRDVARHHISGFDQVEARRMGGEATEELYLASVGLRNAGAETALSVAGMADKILKRIAPTWAPGDPLSEGQTKFLDRLANYGPEECIGYAHPEMRDLDPYRQGYVTTYAPRLYRMADVNVRVLRRADLIDTFVLPHGVEYTAEFPETVSGSIDNPTLDLPGALKKMIANI